MGRRKTFKRDQSVEVLRASWSRAWESATYVAPVAAMRGWHRVRLADSSRLAYHHAITGAEWIGDDLPPEGYVGSSIVIVPTQRVRQAKKQVGKPSAVDE